MVKRSPLVSSPGSDFATLASRYRLGLPFWSTGGARVRSSLPPEVTSLHLLASLLKRRMTTTNLKET
ncbi:hypothetical protein AMTR_s01164p00010780, partial [Amborella trichopoda]